MWAGDVADGEAALAPIRALGPDADFFGVTTYADFQCSIDDPPGFRNCVDGRERHRPARRGDRAHRVPRRRHAGRAVAVFIVAWGGAVARVGAEHSPLAGRESGFIVHPLMLWEDEADDARCIAYARAVPRRHGAVVDRRDLPELPRRGGDRRG